MRPQGTKKDRFPIMEDEYNKIIFLTKRDKNLSTKTKCKLLRVYTLLFHTGCRISEIADFTKEDLKYLITQKNYVLTKTKTSTTQMLKINTSSSQALSALDLADVKEYLFYKNGSSRPMSVSGLTDLVNTHLAIQLNEMYTSHSFRAGYVTRIVEATGNIRVAQKLARHSSYKTTLKYVGATPKQVDDALDLIFKG